MSLFFKIAYRLGLTPWEAAATHPVASRQVAACFDRVTVARGGPGRALDIGCGRGHWSVDLARRGWQVTGVDNVPGALRQARQRAASAGVSVRFSQVDLTRLEGAMALGMFDFFWDFGALHGLSPGDLAAAAAGITALAAPGAVLVLLVWTPGRRGPLPRGLDEDELARAFPRWRIEGADPFDATGLPPALRRVAPRLVRLRLG